MRKQKLLYVHYFCLLLWSNLVPSQGYAWYDHVEDTLEEVDIFGCAGVNTNRAFCTFCDQVNLEIDFLDLLNGNPRSGGTWADLDASGLNISNPNAVDIAGLGTGFYRFRYTVEAGGSCPTDQAVLTLNITGANTIACVDQINVKLQDDCTYELSANEVLAGTTFCDDALEVLVFDTETGFYGDVLGTEQVGKILDVVVFEQGCPNPVCTSTVLLEDKGIPNLNNIDWLPDEITLYCDDLDLFVDNPRTWNDPSYKYYLGGPIINDCSGFQVSVTDRIVYLECGPVFAELRRTFIITDAAGNIASTTLVADFIFPTPDLLSKFEDIVINDCTPEDAVVPETYPFILNHFQDTIYLKEDGCNYSIGFEDREFFVCGGAIKIEREIRFFDWCQDRFFPIDTLVIKIGDFAAPLIKNKADTAKLAVSPFDCTATLSVNVPDLERILGLEFEDCNAEISATGKLETYLPSSNFVDSSYQKGTAINTGFYINNISKGLHRLILTLSDGCKSEGLDTVYLEVVDYTPPVMNCDDRLLVSMSEGPYAQIAFSDLDEGSQDNCELVQLKVRRQVDPAAYQYFDYNNNGEILGEELDSIGFTRFDDQRTNGTYVEYFCSDLDNPEQTLELWGWDSSGNTSTCWSNILLEDKIPPVCRAPKDTVVACYDFRIGQLDLLGFPQLMSTNCGGTIIEALPTIEELNQCGAGTMIRRFQAIKNKGTDRELVGPLCIQTVIIQNIQDYNICFPPDVETTCAGDTSIAGPEISSNDCALFAQHHEDLRLETDNEACYKILRTYELINWCEYIPDNPAVVIDRDVDGDQKPGDERICVLVRPDGFTYLDSTLIETDTIPNQKGYWTNSQENESLTSTGFWKYTQHIKVVDETAPELIFGDTLRFSSGGLNAANACSGSVEVPFSVLETCNTFLVFQLFLDPNSAGDTLVALDDSYLTGDFPDYVITGSFPIGKHQFYIEVNDGCGNTTKMDLPFEVIDDQAPAPICSDVVVVQMSYLEESGATIPQASIDVQAFLQSPVFDCSGQSIGGLVTDFSLNMQDSAVIRDQKFLFFDCSLVNNFIPIEVYAWDEAGNHDFCRTFVEIQDNQSICNSSEGIIQGSIQTANGQMLENVQLDLYGPQSDWIQLNSNGDFAFSELTAGENYTLKPSKNDDFQNGVSTLDLIQIQKHILGVAFIQDPLRLIAADINNSRSISTLDLIQLRKLILNIEDRFQNNSSWRFIEANYTFPDPQNPWMENFPEEVTIENMETNNQLNFIAIKVGDVNASAQANSNAGNTDPRSQETQFLELNEIAMQRGQTYSIPIRIAQKDRVEGLQGTFVYDPEILQLLDIDYGLLHPGQLGLMVDEGKLTFSWNKAQEELENTDNLLVTLRFAVKENTFLSRALTLGSSITPTEAYTPFAERMDLALQFKEITLEDPQAWIGQNYPNPFRGQTVFPYQLTNAGRVDFEVINPQGQIVWTLQTSNDPGQHQLEIPASILPSKGIYQLRMRSAGQLVYRSFIYQ